ncbi:MAG: HEAT repeat domain-containing protein, partial [Gemmatimonadota bacterium]|nr:HEAT repeat domain-containing protein [Gemmatimonadota bacterium]
FSVSSVMATWTLAFRARKIARAAGTLERSTRWKTSVQAVLYDGADVETLWPTIRAEEQVDFVNFLLDYVRRLDGDERALVCRLAEPFLPSIVEQLSRREEGRRMRAVQTLGELGLPEYGPEVIAGLDDQSPLVAMVAASTLARTENSVFAGEVLRRLDRFTHWRQDFLAEMLVSMGSDAIPALRAGLASFENSAKVRAIAADALAGLSDGESADVAVQLLGPDVDVEVRAACLRLLRSVGRGEHLPAVRRCLDSESLPVRLNAVRALGSFGEARDLDALDLRAREDPSPWVAIAAARALKESGGTPALEALAGSEHPRAALGLQVISEARSW